MKCILQRVICFGVLLIVSKFILCGIVQSKDGLFDDLTEKMVEWDNRVGRASNGRIELSGVVVDEDGQYVNGVTIELKKAKFVNMDFNKGFYSKIGTGGEDVDGPGVEREIQVVNGTFHFELRGYCCVGLTFKRDGYYDQKLEFNTKLSEGQEKRIEMEGMIEYYEEFLKYRTGLSLEEKEAIKEDIKGYKEELKNLPKVTEPEVKENNLRVVLEKQGNLTHLINYSGPLEYTTSGKGIVIDFDRRHYKSLIKFENLNEPKQLPINCVYMVADKDLDGKIVTVRKKYYLTDGKTEMEYEVPRRIKLIITAPDSGFIEFKPDPNKKMPRQMKESPETGYQNELVIESGRFERGSRSADIYFYFKVKDKYGKGVIGEFEFKDDNSVIRLWIPFYIQPDVSRNLEAGDRWY